MANSLTSRSLTTAVAASAALLAVSICFVSTGYAQESNTDNAEISASLTEEALIERGNALLEAGDFAAARLVFQAVAHRGNGRAAMLTGVTFDPRYRELAGSSGPKPNAELARQWYALATEMGDDQAARNERDLARWLEQQNGGPKQSGSAENDITAPLRSSAAVPAEGTKTPSTKSQSPAATPKPETPTETEAEAALDGIDQDSPVPDARPDAEAGEGPLEPERPVETVERMDSEPASGANTMPSDFDDRVVRAQLTSAVSDREPVDRLPSSIEVSGGQVNRILFFSEVRNLAGHGVSHRWEHEGRTMADVPFSVRGDTWRMHSSKRITAAMTGAWRVVVVDKGGAELASVSFVLE